ncbi:hypothetical protein HX071_06820 [Myroides marinus]|uniref:hypothetical protein n=1 Tax=Myroides marinus TaxID=703342 RepID=UPI002578B254|nr:hypothetical protein [Myroides marinus]MDM1501912.1 hypothetical protein [Myroides marinus]
MKNEIVSFLSDSVNWRKVLITYDNRKNDVPAKGGVYKIITNAPVEVLKKVTNRIDKKHYDFYKKITESTSLVKELVIQEDLVDGYVVYIGHQANLKQRVREHFFGSKGTGCLNIFEGEVLRQYKWYFEYVEVADIEGFTNTKLSRVYLEQSVRFISGWPVLCSQ